MADDRNDTEDRNVERNFVARLIERTGVDRKDAMLTATIVLLVLERFNLA